MKAAFARRANDQHPNHLWNMKSSLAHLSPTVLAFGTAIGVSLSVFLLAGAGLKGEAIPLLPALGSAVKSVAVTPPTPAPRRTPAPAPSPVFTAPPVLGLETSVSTSRPAAPRVHPAHRARARAGVVRPARPATTPPAPVAVSAPAAATSVSAPQPVSAPKGKGKALGHQRGHAAKAPVTGAPARGNGRAGGHSPEHHHGLRPGQGKKAPAAPPKAKGGPSADHGGGNGHKGGKK